MELSKENWKLLHIGLEGNSKVSIENHFQSNAWFAIAPVYKTCVPFLNTVFTKLKDCEYCFLIVKPITRRQILDSSKLQEFADDHFKFDENGRKLS